MTTPQEQARQMVSSRTTSQLVELARMTEQQLTAKPKGQRATLHRVRLWILEELETRHSLTAAMDKWVMDDKDPELSYTEALIQAIPDEAFH
jgi:hypothetical protein